MRRSHGIAVALAACLVVPAVSVAQDAAKPVAGGGISAAGWMGKIDASEAAKGAKLEDSKLVTMGPGLHVTTGPQVVYWNPANTATGSYTLKGTFTLVKPSGHPNYYGLVFGGSDLDGPQQKYLYFVVAQNGMWLIKNRDGDATSGTVVPRTANDAVKKPDESGKSVNALEVRVGADKIDFVINGTVVHTAQKTGPTAKTDGIYGFRVNHQLEVQVDGFGLSK